MRQAIFERYPFASKRLPADYLPVSETMPDAFEPSPAIAPQRKVKGALLIILAALLVAITALCYSNTLNVPFVFDDGPRIENNHAIRTLWPLSVSTADTSRPLGMISFAVNYAMHGTRVWGYHFTNLAIHILAGLLLFSIARRTFLLPSIAERYRQHATGLAFAVALVWLVHPLGTQAVTYTVQRLESLMGLFYLATLYAFLRAQNSSYNAAWYLISILCCAAGMATKEVMVTAPIVVLLYHRIFLSHSWREVFADSKRYYAGLFLAWGVLAWCLLRTQSEYAAGNLLFVEGMTPWTYFLTQSAVVTHYLRLAFWPDAQSLDYGWPVAQSPMQVILPLALLAALATLTIAAYFRRPAWSFLGLCFFIILAPTSSVVPVIDLAFEHRMYLPLAALTTLVVCLVYELICRIWQPQRTIFVQLALLGLVVMTLVMLTVRRNAVYATEFSLWSDVVAKRPQNARGHNNLGLALYHQQRFAESADACREAVRLKPNFPEAHNNLGNALQEQGDLPSAISHYETAIHQRPDYAEAHNNLGNALQKSGHLSEAIEQYEKVIALQPQTAEAQNNLASALVAQGELTAAVKHYRRALSLKPDFLGARNNLAITLQQQGRHKEAIQEYDEILRQSPNSAQTYLQRSLAHYQQRNFPAAREDLKQAQSLGVTPPKGYSETLQKLQ